MKKVKEPNIKSQYDKIQEFIRENEDYMVQLGEEIMEAQYEGDTSKKQSLKHQEAALQEVVNLMYEVTGFIESKWFE